MTCNPVSFVYPTAMTSNPTTKCAGSGRRVGISSGQMQYTGGAVRANRATDVRCPVCARVFPSARVTHTDHGIPTSPQAVTPNHNR